MESMRIESPGMCAINARADAAGPASGARDELARTMSSLIMSANAPKIFRSRGPSIVTSICARSIDSKSYACGAGRQACGKKAGFPEAYDVPPMTREIETPQLDHGAHGLPIPGGYRSVSFAVVSAALAPNHIVPAPATRCGQMLSAGLGARFLRPTSTDSPWSATTVL